MRYLTFVKDFWIMKGIHLELVGPPPEVLNRDESYVANLSDVSNGSSRECERLADRGRL
jgi:hypothetical protein